MEIILEAHMTLVNNTNGCGYHIFEVHRMMCLCWVHTSDVVGFVVVTGTPGNRSIELGRIHF
jgi:uncharacterized protein (UPF0179 family)